MDTTDIIMIAAILLAPILAVQVQKYLERYKDKKERKIKIYKTLMATRVANLSERHVIALNSIDLEFYEKKYSEVQKAWKLYLDHLSTSPNDNLSKESIVWITWEEKCQNFMVSLLLEMGNSLNYKFDEVDIKKNIYAPKAHLFRETEVSFMRRGINEVLLGTRAIKIEIDRKSKNESNLNQTT